jgi:chemotaxis protein MotB
MSPVNDRGHQEIIIIKRGNEEEEGHHGGAWKIAFADFMTAMMALFLVLWLINAANEETKRAVASYFNPIKLVDRNRSVKGLDEQKGGVVSTEEMSGTSNPVHAQQKEVPPTTPPENQNIAKNEFVEADSESDFFRDPMSALDQIEASVLERNGISNEIETNGEDTKSGKFTDPFKVGYWKDSPEPDEIRANGELDADSGKMEEEPSPLTDPSASATGKAESTLTPDAAKLEDMVRQEIEKSLGKDAPVIDAIKVKQTDNGILIQITDLPASPMFDIGKAVPNGETLLAINAVAKALNQVTGKIHIHGHTDARKFGNSGNGNWQLSMNRAQSVYFMLFRAGLADSRFSEITGFADRKPIVPVDPLADQNRRIEIFLENT